MWTHGSRPSGNQKKGMQMIKIAGCGITHTKNVQFKVYKSHLKRNEMIANTGKDEAKWKIIE